MTFRRAEDSCGSSPHKHSDKSPGKDRPAGPGLLRSYWPRSRRLLTDTGRDWALRDEGRGGYLPPRRLSGARGGTTDTSPVLYWSPRATTQPKRERPATSTKPNRITSSCVLRPSGPRNWMPPFLNPTCCARKQSFTHSSAYHIHSRLTTFLLSTLSHALWTITCRHTCSHLESKLGEA